MKHLLVLVIFATIVTSALSIDEKFIFSFIRQKQVRFATIFGCFTTKGNLAFTKELYKLNIRNSVYNLDAIDSLNLTAALHSRGPVAVIVDLECKNSDTLVLEAGRFNFFADRYFWLLIDSNNENGLEILNRTMMDINVNIVLAQHDKAPNSYQLLDVYNPSFVRGGKLKHKNIGFYNEDVGYSQMLNQPSKCYSRRDMRHIRLKAQVVLTRKAKESLKTLLNRDEDIDNDPLIRGTYQTVKSIKEYLRFNLNVRLGKSWGYLLPNGSIDGMVADLHQAKVDFSGGPFILREERIRFTSFIPVPIQRYRQILIFRHPKNAMSKSEPFLAPLEPSVWYCCAVIMILSILVLKLSTVLEDRLNKPEQNSAMSWSYLSLTGLSTLCQQGCDRLPLYLSSRIVIFSVLLFTALFYEFYESSILSSVLMEPVKTMKHLKDLVDSDLSCGSEDTVYSRNFFSVTTYSLAKQLFAKKMQGQNNSGFTRWQEGIERVKKGGYAFLVDTESVYKTIQRTFSDESLCELTEIRILPDVPLFISTSKHSSFREIISHSALRLLENGAVRRTLIHWHNPKPACTIDLSKTQSSLGMPECKDALILLLFFIFVSLVVLLVEYFFKNAVMKIKGIKEVPVKSQFEL